MNADVAFDASEECSGPPRLRPGQVAGAEWAQQKRLEMAESHLDILANAVRDLQSQRDALKSENERLRQQLADDQANFTQRVDAEVTSVAAPHNARTLSHLSPLSFVSPTLFQALAQSFPHSCCLRPSLRVGQCMHRVCCRSVISGIMGIALQDAREISRAQVTAQAMRRRAVRSDRRAQIAEARAEQAEHRAEQAESRAQEIGVAARSDDAIP